MGRGVIATPRWLPHDLLRVRRLPSFDNAPSWLHDAFAYAPFGVVRRGTAPAGCVAVGIRGATRAQRYGAWVEHADVIDAVSPERLMSKAPHAGREALPAFVALDALRRDGALLNTRVWGPTGSTGFELATGVATVTGSSDLDVLVRVPQPISCDAAAHLLDELREQGVRANVRIDAQLETPLGGVALAEWAQHKTRVMVRGPNGPFLTTDPWSALEPVMVDGDA